MSCTAVILAALVGGLFSRANSLTCLSCTDVVRPSDCNRVQECGSHEKCFVESYVIASGDIRYNVGCMNLLKCAAAGRKRDVLSSTVLNEVQQKNDFGAVPEEQSEENNLMVCYECCDTEICNIKGCGEEGLLPNSGLLCYACEHETAPDKCNNITQCSSDSSCFLSTVHVGLDIFYKSDCIPTHVCHLFGVLDIGAYQLVGRRDVDMISRSQRGATCNKCCSKNLCNSDNCTSVITPSTSTTQTPATLAPVNGGWSTWSHWNLCSVTCGGGHHYRVRFCNITPSTGASCSGSNRDTQTCSNQPCIVNSGWSTWSHWNLCSVTCGGGHQNRVRSCNITLPTGTSCSGSNSETQICNNQSCTVDGQWGSWMTWSACSETCGSGGTSSRQRNCDNPRPSATGLYCIGQASENRHCSVPYVPPAFKGGHTYSRAAGSQVIIGCVDRDSGSPPHIRQIRWTAPQISGHPFPTNFEQYADGSLVIHGLKPENCGPYSCTVDTDCGSYNSPDYYVSIKY